MDRGRQITSEDLYGIALTSVSQNLGQGVWCSLPETVTPFLTKIMQFSLPNFKPGPIKQGLEGGVWISSHGLNFRTFTNHVTFFSDFTNLMKLTSGFALRPLLLAIS